MKPARRQPAPWPVDKLLTRDRNAGTVYLALIALAVGKRQVNTTRASIAEVCGLYRDRITSALAALHDAGWVNRRYGRAGNRCWFRINFPQDPLSPVALKISFRDRKKAPSPGAEKHRRSAASKTVENQLQGTRPCAVENQLHPLEGIGDALQPSPLVPTGAGTAGIAQHPAQDTGENNAACDAITLTPIVDVLRLKPTTRGGRKYE